MSKITDTAMTVLKERYFLENESTWEDLTERVGGHFGKTLEEESSFINIMRGMDFLPNSPALMNAGTSIDSHSACFVLPVEDSIESIYKFYKDAAIISKSGGGVGANYSAIRASGNVVNSTDGVASGPLSFMAVQDKSTDVIKQGGRRRGANMGILSCEHEDIWDFISAKDETGVLTNFNLSVGITDEFMESATKARNVYHMGSVELQKINSDKKLWDEITQRAWSSAEPGVLFMDTIERGNLVPKLGKLDATNPCSEQPLLAYESCTLGSINLSTHLCTSYIEIDGSTQPCVLQVDWDKLHHTTRTAVLFLNRILDKSIMPIPECQEAMEKTRKIGLGYMGLADTLIYLEIPYDTQEARDLAAEIQSFITETADEFSRELGDKEGYYGGYYEGAPKRRNAHITTQAPTGTLSTLANCSSGVEPYYAAKYTRENMGQTFTMYAAPVEVMAKEEERSEEEILLRYPELFKGANEIHWRDHIDMTGAIQNAGVDSSISKTINMGSDVTVADVKEAYERAYEKGLKGITIYRDGSRETQVLSSESSGANDGSGSRDVSKRPGQPSVGSEGREDQDKVDTWPPELFKLDLPDVAKATRYRVSVNEQKVYINVTEGDEGEPLEIFVKFAYESDPVWNTLCRQLSLSLRYGIPLTEIIKQLDKSVVGVGDMSAKISRVLKRYLPVDTIESAMAMEAEDIKELLDEDRVHVYKGEDMMEGPVKEKNMGGALCPKCNHLLTPEGGCFSCKSCGWEKCS